LEVVARSDKYFSGHFLAGDDMQVLCGLSRLVTVKSPFRFGSGSNGLRDQRGGCH